MPRSRCPNIKNDILQLRSKIGELNNLKTNLLQGDPTYEEILTRLKHEIAYLMAYIDKRIDVMANNTILTLIKNLGNYKQVWNFRQGKAMVQDKNWNRFHIGLNRKPFYKDRYAEAGDYSEGMAWVRGFDSNFFHIRLNGKPAYDKRYKSVGNFSECRAIAKDNSGKWFHIGFDGEPAYDARFIWVGDYSQDKAKVKDFDDNEFYINLDGNRIPDKD
jgi:hypothetical protein